MQLTTLNELVTIKLRNFRHHNEPVVGIYLSYDRDLIGRMKKNLLATWNPRYTHVSRNSFTKFKNPIDD
ncbi:MAG: hypothetical protein AB2L20_16265 [Mangrovibacterium sp.]